MATIVQNVGLVPTARAFDTPARSIQSLVWGWPPPSEAPGLRGAGRRVSGCPEAACLEKTSGIEDGHCHPPGEDPTCTPR